MKVLINLLISLVRIIYKLKLDKYCIGFLSFILNRVIGYRKKVILKNISIISPNSDATILANKFYNYFANLTFETLWAYSATKDEILNKVSIDDNSVKLLNAQFNYTLLISHIGNWELFCQWAPIFFVDTRVAVLFTDIKNTSLNQFSKKLREKNGAKLISTKSILELFRLQRDTTKTANLFAMDQNPGDPYNQYWTEFFGKKVPVLSGYEKFVSRFNQATFFLNVAFENGKYQLSVEEIGFDTSKEYDLTEKAFEKLENNILLDPSLWLLSHNRFKYVK